LILDTNALSAIADGQPDATKHFVQAREVAIPVIVLGEYRFGITHSRYQHKYEKWLNEMISNCRILEVNEETAVLYAALRVQLKTAGTPIPSNDVWVAALCRQHGLPLLSRDEHFKFVKGLRRQAW